MALLTDGLLLAATLFAATYCWVLARRVDALKDLDKGLGGTIVRLTRQIELARATLDEARGDARDGRQDLARLSARAEAAAEQLRLLLAAVNDPNGSEAPATAVRSVSARAARDPAPGGRAPSSSARSASALAAPGSAARASSARPSATPPLQSAPAGTRSGPGRPEPAADGLPKPRNLPAVRSLSAAAKSSEAETKGEEEILATLRALAGGEA